MSNLIVECFLDSDCCVFFSPLKNISGWKLSLTAPPRWYHKTSVPNVRLTVGKGSIAFNGRRRTGGWHQKPFDCCILLFILPLKIWVDENLVMPRPPDDIINKWAYPTLDLLWGRGPSHWNGHQMTGGGAESQFDCRDFFWIIPLKISFTKI